MAKFRKKPVVIEAITFAEFIEFGKAQGSTIVDNFPWSFEYNGCQVTHENDECYLIPVNTGGIERFTPNDMLITGVSGEVYPCPLEVFAQTYELVEGDM